MIWNLICFQRQSCHSPRKGTRGAEPVSVTLTGRLSEVSLITSNDSILSLQDQFNMKPYEISQCAKNGVPASLQPPKSDAVLHLNIHLTSYESCQLPVGPITAAYRSCVANDWRFNTEILLKMVSKRCRLDYQTNLITHSLIRMSIDWANAQRGTFSLEVNQTEIDELGSAVALQCTVCPV